MKKIAFLIRNLDIYGGVERVTANLAREFQNYAEVYIVSYLKNTNGQYLDWYPENVKLLELGLESFSIHKDYFRNRKILCDTINNYGFDTIIIQNDSIAFFAKEIRKNTCASVIFCDHGSIYYGPFTLRRKYGLLRAAKGCDELVALTQRCKNDYVKNYHISRDKIHVIPNWIEDNSKQKTEYDPKSDRIIAVGRLASVKRFNLLIDAFNIVHKSHPDWSLDLYGDGEEWDNLVSMIKDYGLEESFILKGKRLNVTELYSDYSFLVMTSEAEGLPMVLLEAKQSNLPLVSFDIASGPSEIITDGKNGLLVSSGDVDAMAEAMCKMIENPKLRIMMSENADTDFDKYSKETILKKWLEFLDISK